MTDKHKNYDDNDMIYKELLEQMFDVPLERIVSEAGWSLHLHEINGYDMGEKTQYVEVWFGAHAFTGRVIKFVVTNECEEIEISEAAKEFINVLEQRNEI